MFGGTSFSVDRGVFDPEIHLSGLVLADELSGRDLAGLRILEVGTGCGLLAHTCWSRGATVVATDVDARSTACAKTNLRGTSVDVRLGDLFAPVNGMFFDLMITNPPYEVGRSRRATLKSPDFLVRLAATWTTFATTLLLAFPTDASDLLDAAGFSLVLTKEIPTAGRTLGVFESHPVESESA